jgi:hypothetical protein
LNRETHEPAEKSGNPTGGSGDSASGLCAATNPSIKPAVKAHPERVSDRELYFRGAHEVVIRRALYPLDYAFAVLEPNGRFSTIIGLDASPDSGLAAPK